MDLLSFVANAMSLRGSKSGRENYPIEFSGSGPCPASHLPEPAARGRCRGSSWLQNAMKFAKGEPKADHRGREIEAEEMRHASGPQRAARAARRGLSAAQASALASAETELQANSVSQKIMSLIYIVL